MERSLVCPFALLALLALPGCTTVQHTPCAGNARPQLRAELIFGRRISGGGTIGGAPGGIFVDEEVTPRFPDGFTVLDGRCQWRGPGEGGIVKEDSKVLVIAMPDEPHHRARLDEIATAYKRRFRQESVARFAPSCQQ